MEKVFYENVNGNKVFCHFSEPVTPSKKIVIMSHGFRGSSHGPARQFVDFQRILNKEGFSVLRFDQPNSGDSSGDYIHSSFREWVKTIVYFVNKYLTKSYQVALLGQSMGATATVAATSNSELKGKISCILLWVPDAKADINLSPDTISEEGGQKYYDNFWIEARDSNFFQSLKKYNGGIHLVYGEKDRYVRREYINETISIVEEKKQPVLVLKGQDHSPWDFELVQRVYEEELLKLKDCIK